MLVKICGIQTIEAARQAVDAGADFIGFVFAPSRRRITPEKAAELGNVIPQSVKKVGVFVNESYETIMKTAETAKLDIIQLHGEEPPELAEMLPYEIIKAFSSSERKIKNYPCSYYLVDSPPGKYRGGTGIPFDWEILKEMEVPKDSLMLAGGLNPENVNEAIQAARPAVVDVSSGVETEGVKDPEKMKAFVHAAKNKERMI